MNASQGKPRHCKARLQSVGSPSRAFVKPRAPCEHRSVRARCLNCLLDSGWSKPRRFSSPDRRGGGFAHESPHPPQSQVLLQHQRQSPTLRIAAVRQRLHVQVSALGSEEQPQQSTKQPVSSSDDQRAAGERSADGQGDSDPPGRLDSGSSQVSSSRGPGGLQVSGPLGDETRDQDGVEHASGSQEEQKEESVGVKIALSVLRFYKRELSPLIPPSCRFLPTCSEYAMDAYSQQGVGRGTVLTVWRLARCNPFGNSGYDPVKWPPPGLEGLFR